MTYTAIFGGTFNPFHIGHFEMLEALQNDPQIDEIFLMPDKIPPHKVCDYMLEDSIRIESCRIAAENFSKARLCLIEFDREGKSYTYDTVLRLQKDYPYKNFLFVCGGDMLVYFDKWYKYEELMKLLPFMAFRRTDTDNTLFDTYVTKLSEMGMKIIVNDRKIIGVSSTEIRKNFLKAKEMLPKDIFEFLISKGVYSENS